MHVSEEDVLRYGRGERVHSCVEAVAGTSFSSICSYLDSEGGVAGKAVPREGAQDWDEYIQWHKKKDEKVAGEVE